MRTYFVTAIILALILFPYNVSAIEVAPRISDREIVEKLSALDAKIDTKIAIIDGKIDKVQQQIADTNRRIDKAKDSTNRQIADLKDLMLWGFGILFAGMFTLVGFVLWDRRTALSPAIKKNKELEEREDKVEKALKEYAYKEPKLAEILRNVGIM